MDLFLALSEFSGGAAFDVDIVLCIPFVGYLFITCYRLCGVYHLFRMWSFERNIMLGSGVLLCHMPSL